MANPQQTAWNSYFYPGTDVLRNNANIRDAAELQHIENLLVDEVIAGLYQENLSAEGDYTVGERLQHIHQRLFGELYEWGGQYRYVNMAKGGHSFGDHASMGMYMRQAQGAINRFDWDAASEEQKIDKLADIHTDLNFAHPFREGNGRTTRMFMAELAQSHNVILEWEKVGMAEWNQASIDSFVTPDGLTMDSQPLRRIYSQIT